MSSLAPTQTQTLAPKKHVCLPTADRFLMGLRLISIWPIESALFVVATFLLERNRAERSCSLWKVRGWKCARPQPDKHYEPSSADKQATRFCFVFSTNDTRLKQMKNIYEMNTANASGEQTAASLSSMNAMRCSPAPHKCYALIIRIKPFEHLLSSALRLCVASACRHS